LITILSLLLSLSLLVLVHELGHFLVGRRANVIIEEFGIGYPPRLLTLWRSDGWMEVEGKRYIIPGKLRLPEDLNRHSRVRYSLGQDGKGRTVLTNLEVVDEDDPEGAPSHAIQALDKGVIYSINAIPFGGFVKFLGEEDPTYPGSLASKSKLTRIAVLSAGAAMNLVMAFLFFAGALMLGRPVVADPENAVVSAVAPGSPAEQVGLQAGDMVLEANGQQILEVDDLIAITRAASGQPVDLLIQRGDERLEIRVTPRLDPPAGEGAMGVVLRARTELRRYGLLEALWAGARETVSLTVLIISIPVQIIQGLIPAEQARPVGPVGIGQLVGGAVRFSLESGWWFPVMQIMGSLSMALAVSNLLPLPALDGGRILFVLVEAIRGKRVDPAKEGLIHLVGLLILVMLMLFVTWQDIFEPVPMIEWPYPF
jgi:regulator of sigma E protease